MIETFCKVFVAWDTPTQLVFLLVLASLALFLLAGVAWWLLALWRLLLQHGVALLRGYPPSSSASGSEAAAGRQECYQEDDNLTGYCLRPGGCRTVGECQRTIRMIDDG